MNTVFPSDQNIQLIPTFPTRRTSPQIFEASLNAILAAILHFLILGVDFIHDEILLHVDNVRYAFRTLHQRVQVRKFPANLEELWPYIGLPQDEVAASLGVTTDLLDRRMVENQLYFWPAASDMEYVLLAVQLTHDPNANNEFVLVDVRHTRVLRTMPLDGVRQLLNHLFQLELLYEEDFFELHTEQGGVRYGPLWQNLQWQEVLAVPEFFYKVNLLMVHY